MEHLFKIKTRINGKNVYLFVNSDLKFGIEKENIIFISNIISPFQLGAFILGSLAGQLERNYRLEDKQVEIYENGNKTNAKGHIIIYIGKRSDDLNEFNLHENSIKITCSAVDENNPEKSLFINYRLSAVNSFSYLGQLECINKILPYYLFTELKVVKHDDKISIKVGGGQPAYFKNDNIDIFLFALERWLSGQAYIDRNAIKKFNELPENQRPKNRPYYICRYNREGILFDGKVRPTITVNGLKAKLSYMDTAELYYVIKNMTKNIE